MKDKIQYRSISGVSIRETDKPGFIGVLEGYAAVFNSDSEEFGAGYGKPWVERIAPGAFTRSLKEKPDVRALWAHDSSMVLARAPNTLTLVEDERGLRVEMNLIDTTLNRDALASVRSKNVDAMSFGFYTRKAAWTEGDKQDVRTVTDAELLEVSVVAWPAYSATSISARSIDEIAQEVIEERKQFLSVRNDAPKDQTLMPRLWAKRFEVL